MILQQSKDKTFKEKYDDLYKKGGCVEFVVFENFEGLDSYSKHLEIAKNVLIQNCSNWERDFENINPLDEIALDKIYPSYFDLEILKPSGKEISLQEFLGPFYDLKTDKVILNGVKRHLNGLFFYDKPEEKEYQLDFAAFKKSYPFSSEGFITFGFADSFLEPPHSLSIGKNIREKGLYFMDFITYFFSDLYQLEIYKWSIDCSDYFDMGKEWWGSFFWTVYNPIKKNYIGIIASTTD